MSVKLYREIIEFLKSQGRVISSFENENKCFMEYKELQIFIRTLRENLCLLEEKTEKIIDGSDKD